MTRASVDTRDDGLSVEQRRVLRALERAQAHGGAGATVNQVAERIAMTRDRIRSCLTILERRDMAHQSGTGGARGGSCWHVGPGAVVEEHRPKVEGEGPIP